MARVKVNGCLFDENLHRFPFSDLFENISLDLDSIERQIISQITSYKWYKCHDQYVNTFKVVSIRIDDVGVIDD